MLDRKEKNYVYADLYVPCDGIMQKKDCSKYEALADQKIKLILEQTDKPYRLKEPITEIEFDAIFITPETGPNAISRFDKDETIEEFETFAVVNNDDESVSYDNLCDYFSCKGYFNLQVFVELIQKYKSEPAEIIKRRNEEIAKA